MSEYVTAWHFSERAQKDHIESTGEAALAIVDQTYGTGYPEYREGDMELSYHNGHHAREVGKAAYQLCTLLELDPLTRITGRTTGYAHDIVQLKGRGIDEGESAEWIQRELAKGDIVVPTLRNMAAAAIIGTQPRFDSNGKLIGQRATELEHASREAESLVLSVASADLGELYLPEGQLLAHELFREMNGMAAPAELSVNKLITFQRNNVELLETYQYPLPEAERAFTSHKTRVIEHAKNVLDQLEAGTLDSWRAVTEFDRAFIRHERA